MKREEHGCWVKHFDELVLTEQCCSGQEERKFGKIYRSQAVQMSLSFPAASDKIM
jgi:hypothetical protein